MRLALALVLAGCAVDSYGVRALPVQLRELARAREDGSLACAYVFAVRGGVDPFSVACRYARDEHTCACTAEGFRGDRPVLPVLAEEHRFVINPCSWLPDGLSWPPTRAYAAAVRGL